MKLIFLLSVFLFSVQCFAQIAVTDFMGKTIELNKPAKRVIALAPHIVENMYSAGAGNTLIGAVDYCDFPEEAKNIPRVGAINKYSLEKIISLKPDLVLFWHSGNTGNKLSTIQELGIKVYVSDPKNLKDIAKSIRDFGKLTGHNVKAEKSALEFERRFDQLKSQYNKKANSRSQPSVLYQVWNDPILTLNNNHLISKVINLCGGVNAFGDLPSLVPKLSVESVFEADPTSIIASGMGTKRPEWLDEWKRWGELKAVKEGNLFYIPPDIIQRHTMRILDGAEMMCDYLGNIKI